jgi:hypothetical protein
MAQANTPVEAYGSAFVEFTMAGDRGQVAFEGDTDTRWRLVLILRHSDGPSGVETIPVGPTGQALVPFGGAGALTRVALVVDNIATDGFDPREDGDERAATFSYSFTDSWQSPPRNLVATTAIEHNYTAYRRNVYLRWQPGEGEPATGYHVYRGRPGGRLSRITDSPTVDTAYDDLGLPPEAVFAYVVTAMDAEGRESIPSFQVQAGEES